MKWSVYVCIYICIIQICTFVWCSHAVPTLLWFNALCTTNNYVINCGSNPSMAFYAECLVGLVHELRARAEFGRENIRFPIYGVFVILLWPNRITCLVPLLIMHFPHLFFFINYLCWIYCSVADINVHSTGRRIQKLEMDYKNVCNKKVKRFRDGLHHQRRSGEDTAAIWGLINVFEDLTSRNEIPDIWGNNRRISSE